MTKLHLGCGDVYLDGWINIDLDSPRADLNLDVRNVLPYSDNSVDFIYSEHFIEHFSAQDGVAIMRECFRVLRTEGILRTATPDLDRLLLRYFFFWKRQKWITQYGLTDLKTRAEMLNLCFSGWGHQYLYSQEELIRRLREAGFSDIRKRAIGSSKCSELMNLETRRESELILEAVK